MDQDSARHYGTNLEGIGTSIRPNTEMLKSLQSNTKFPFKPDYTTVEVTQLREEIRVLRKQLARANRIATILAVAGIAASVGCFFLGLLLSP